METLPLICLITSMFLDCDPNMKPTPEQQNLMVRYEAADKKINDYFNAIESSETTDDERKNIVCESLPAFYNKEYKPLLLQVNKDSKDAELDSNLKQAVDGFQKQYSIKC